MQLEHRDPATSEARRIGSPNQHQMEAALAGLTPGGSPLTLELVGGDIITVWRLEGGSLLVNVKSGPKQWARLIATEEGADAGWISRVDEVGTPPWTAALRAQPLYDGPPLSVDLRPSDDGAAKDENAAQLVQRLDAEGRASVVPPAALAAAPGLATNTIYGLAPSFVSSKSSDAELVVRTESQAMLPMYGAPPPEILRRRRGQMGGTPSGARRKWVLVGLVGLAVVGAVWLSLRS